MNHKPTPHGSLQTFDFLLLNILVKFLWDQHAGGIDNANTRNHLWLSEFCSVAKIGYFQPVSYCVLEIVQDMDSYMQ